MRETDKLKIHKEQPSDETHIVVDEAEAQVQVVVTQVFCPNGHNLVGVSDETFDGYPGIDLWVEHSGESGMVTISPIHGDHDKRGMTFPAGAKLEICCPECKQPLPELAPCRCSDLGRLRKLYLTRQLSEAHLVAVCDIWGCPLSRVIDNFEMFSEFLDMEDDGE